MMNDPLSELHDIQLPEAIHTWPIATGWIILAIVCIAAISAAIYAFMQYRKNNAWRKEASNAVFALSNINNDIALKQEALILLKQILAKLNINNAHSLYGKQLDLALDSLNIDSAIKSRITFHSFYQEDNKLSIEAFTDLLHALCKVKAVKHTSSSAKQQGANHGL